MKTCNCKEVILKKVTVENFQRCQRDQSLSKMFMLCYMIHLLHNTSIECPGDAVSLSGDYHQLGTQR